MKSLIAVIVLVLLSGCAGISLQGGPGPEVREFAYKDIINCVVVPDAPGFSDCKIKVGDSGLTVVVRLQTSEIPAEPVE